MLMFKNHPKGLIPAALSNMGERFGYYITPAVESLNPNFEQRKSNSTAFIM